ncbi:efflux RND transporter periplasmic adaptor subunit [Sphaerotilus montanus]|uniref:Cu(I)/Ag(I) efflux system membrane fusion protein n=1 Tax=Sphaerotilus montanus TaxID=522889 RepID=A0A7Y9R0M8_9BURK|nr:efflux RND transporter periplasmic adaptor subunit [Sphaerotilus montanus]NYG33035.1 Cu(I)/Ag(I) efflux system membrane fusion protein [Sphaerotilus montanus]NZD57291.1 efflux RND transporter periplasmic adaptor subunit [Sphaerotilus montanus]
MQLKPLLIGLTAAGVLAATGYGLYTTGLQRGMGMAAAPAPAASPAQALPQSIAQGEDATRRHLTAGLKAGDVDPATGRRILYYHDPMVPGNRFDKPAKSPFMDMMLVPVYAGGSGDNGVGEGSTVTVSPRLQQNLGVRTVPVTEGTLSPPVTAVGSIAFNERDQATVQARATGYVERLHVRATLDRVAKGQALAELYVPDWIAAQEEFLSVRRMQGTDLAPLVEAARQRMRQVGMNEAQIASVEGSGKTQARTILLAPISGVVTELAVREGMTVTAGTTLFRLNGLGTVWANAEVPESQAALLRPGTRVRAKSTAMPEVTLDGQVQALLPEVNPTTRTLKARLELANPGGRLVPGMSVQMQFTDLQVGKALLVPTEAVIQTGRRTVVIVADGEGRSGHFRPVEVEIGTEGGGQTEVRRGLQVGQRVVVSSQFLIDSEASLKGVEARLNAAESKPQAEDTTPRHEGDATVESLSRDALTLSHGPIPSLKWGPMTMDFKPPPQGLPSGLKAGDKVRFAFYMGTDNLPQLTVVTVQASASKAKPVTGAKTGSQP